MNHETVPPPLEIINVETRNFRRDGQGLTTKEALLFTIGAKEAGEVINRQALAFIINKCRTFNPEYPTLDLFTALEYQNEWHPMIIGALNHLQREEFLRETADGYELSETGRGAIDGVKYLPEAFEALREVIEKSAKIFTPKTSDR